MNTHEHQCDCCGYVWMCDDYEWKNRPLEECKIHKGIAVNGQGPYCDACRNGIMFLRHARLSNRSPQRLMKMLLRIEGGGDTVAAAAGSASQPTLIRSGRPGETPGPATNL